MVGGVLLVFAKVFGLLSLGFIPGALSNPHGRFLFYICFKDLWTRAFHSRVSTRWARLAFLLCLLLLLENHLKKNGLESPLIFVLF